MTGVIRSSATSRCVRVFDSVRDIADILARLAQTLGVFAHYFTRQFTRPNLQPTGLDFCFMDLDTSVRGIELIALLQPAHRAPTPSPPQCDEQKKRDGWLSR